MTTTTGATYLCPNPAWCIADHGRRDRARDHLCHSDTVTLCTDIVGKPVTASAGYITSDDEVDRAVYASDEGGGFAVHIGDTSLTPGQLRVLITNLQALERRIGK